MIVAIRGTQRFTQDRRGDGGQWLCLVGVISGLAAAVTDEGVLMTSAYSGLLLPAVLMAELVCRGRLRLCCCELLRSQFCEERWFLVGNTVDGASVTLGVLSKPGKSQKGHSGWR